MSKILKWKYFIIYKVEDCFIISYCIPCTGFSSELWLHISWCLSKFFSVLTTPNFIQVLINFPDYSKSHWGFSNLIILSPLNPFYTLLPDYSWTKSLCLNLVFQSLSWPDLSLFFSALFPFHFIPHLSPYNLYASLLIHTKGDNVFFCVLQRYQHLQIRPSVCNMWIKVDYCLYFRNQFPVDSHRVIFFFSKSI